VVEYYQSNINNYMEPENVAVDPEVVVETPVEATVEAVEAPSEAVVEEVAPEVAPVEATELAEPTV
jgi:hypothetical protein